jgi:hypothetical protein
MKTRLRSLIGIILVLTLALCWYGCSDKDEVVPGKGKVSIYLTDAPLDADNIEGVYITIVGVDVNGPNGWQSISSKRKTFNLLDFQSGLSTLLSSAELDTGKYSEVRMLLDVAEEGKEKANEKCFIRFKDKTSVGLFVPSGQQTGYKIKGDFHIKGGKEASVTIDFDVRKSVHKAGNSNKYMLKPVTRLVLNNEVGIIQGTYADADLYEKVSVFVYREGTFTMDDAYETADRPYFANAINYGEPDNAGSFKLAFLPPGRYDVYVAAFFSNGTLNGIVAEKKGVTVSTGETLNVSL